MLVLSDQGSFSPLMVLGLKTKFDRSFKAAVMMSVDLLAGSGACPKPLIRRLL